MEAEKEGSRFVQVRLGLGMFHLVKEGGRTACGRVIPEGSDFTSVTTPWGISEGYCRTCRNALEAGSPGWLIAY